MIKKIFYILFGLVIVALFVGTTGYLYQQSQKRPVIFETASPVIGDIEQVTVASGTIVPRKEIKIKPLVAGIIDEIRVQPGEIVQKGTVLAKIQIVPNLEKLNEAENRLNKARIHYNDVKQELDRQQKLYEKQLISQSDFKRYQIQVQTAQTDLEAAQNNLRLVKEGVARQDTAENNTLVESTVNGMILEVPVEEGTTVVETSAFNEGTTIAVVADMNALVFEGKIDESEVGKLQEGMELNLTIGAIEGQEFKATLEYIAPKGNKEGDGAVQFQIKAAVKPEKEVLIRAGYSANAKIVLAKKEKVLTLLESLILYDKEQQPYVEVEVGEQQFERRDLELGLSDGINVEILSGITLDDKIKKP
jgi:HlyD family secretion protein